MLSIYLGVGIKGSSQEAFQKEGEVEVECQ